MLNKNTIRGALLAIRGGFASCDELINFIFREIEEKGITNLNSLISTFQKEACTATKITQDIAAKILIARDLEKAKILLNNYQFDDLDNALRKHYLIFLDHINSLRIKLDYTSFNIVDNFPKPYDTLDFSAMSFDVGDNKAYGLPIGIFLKRDKLAPFVSSGTIAHELVHQIFGRYYYNYLARGLEDGICDFVSYFILLPRVFEYRICENIIFNRRLSVDRAQVFNIYRDNLAQAFVIYKNYGLEGLFNLLRMTKKVGREIIKRVERDCLIQGCDQLPYLSKGNWDGKISRSADFFLCFPRRLVVTPLARYIAEKIKLGDIVDKVLGAENIDEEEGKEALQELIDKVYLVFIYDNKIVCDETKVFVESNTLRYSLARGINR